MSCSRLSFYSFREPQATHEQFCVRFPQYKRWSPSQGLCALITQSMMRVDDMHHPLSNPLSMLQRRHFASVMGLQRRSSTAFCLLSPLGWLICWISMLQSVPALSDKCPRLEAEQVEVQVLHTDRKTTSPFLTFSAAGAASSSPPSFPATKAALRVASLKQRISAGSRARGAPKPQPWTAVE